MGCWGRMVADGILLSCPSWAGMSQCLWVWLWHLHHAPWSYMPALTTALCWLQGERADSSTAPQAPSTGHAPAWVWAGVVGTGSCTAPRVHSIMFPFAVSDLDAALKTHSVRHLTNVLLQLNKGRLSSVLPVKWERTKINENNSNTSVVVAFC